MSSETTGYQSDPELDAYDDLTVQTCSLDDGQVVEPKKKSEIRWHCRFCIDELMKTNYFYNKKYVEEIEIYYLSKSCAKLQSFVKMFISRYSFRKFRKGIVKLQRLYRWQRLSYATRWRRANQKWPMRIRLHDIWMFAKVNENNERGHKPPSLTSSVTLPNFVSVGDGLSTITYENNIGWNKKANPDPILPTSQPTVDILQNAHVDAPIYHKGQGNGQAHPRGTLFLTVVVNEMQSDGKMTFGSKPPSSVMASQYRYDLPLKYPRSLSTIKPSQLKTLGIETKNMDDLMKHYKVVCMTTSKPYILVPYVCANLDVQYILSEIRDWPKGVVIGRSAQQSMFSTLYNRKVMVYRQGIRIKFEPNEGVDEELPVQEEGGKLSLTVFKPKPPPGSGYGGSKTTREDHGDRLGTPKSPKGTVVLPNISPVPGSPKKGANHRPETPKSLGSSLLRSPKNIPKSPKASGPPKSPVLDILAARKGHQDPSCNDDGSLMYNPNQLSDSMWHGGMVTSSIIAVDTHDGGANEAGFITQLAQDVLESSKKKMWCVLIDRMLMMYSVETGNKSKVDLKMTLDLTVCQVYMLASEVIRLRTSTETVHLHCATLNEHEIWFKKLYEQSASAFNMAYAAYHKRHSKDNLSYGKSFSQSGALAASRSSLEKHRSGKNTAREKGRKSEDRDSNSKIFQIFPGLNAKDLSAPNATKHIPTTVCGGASSGKVISDLEERVDYYLKNEKEEEVYNEEELEMVMSRPAEMSKSLDGKTAMNYLGPEADKRIGQTHPNSS